jgi:RNA polymerase sigma-70 factor, ECF subfamily
VLDAGNRSSHDARSPGVKPSPLGAESGEARTLPRHASDVELLRAVAGGSEPAFAELRSRYGGAIERQCRSIARWESEDCTQEVFARIWRKAALFDPDRGSAAAWLLTLARRTALNFRAGHRPWRPVTSAAGEGAVSPPDVEGFWLEGALARLPERERRVVELAYYGDLSESAIAAELQAPLGSVKSWKRRGLNRLAELLGEESP